MRTILAILLFILLIFPAATVAGQELHFATDSFPPYYEKTENGTQGIIYELLKLTLGEMDIPFTITHVPWNRALRMAETNVSDGIPGAAKSERRERTMIFPAEPFVITQVVVFFPANKTFEYNDISSLNDKRVGVIRGYTYGGEFDKAEQWTREEGESLEQNFRKLTAGRVDLVLGYKAPGLLRLQRMGLSEQIDFAHTPFRTVPVYMAFSRKPGYSEFAEKFSLILKKIKKTEACTKAIEALGLPAGVDSPCQ